MAKKETTEKKVTTKKASEKKAAAKKTTKKTAPKKTVKKEVTEKEVVVEEQKLDEVMQQPEVVEEKVAEPVEKAEEQTTVNVLSKVPEEIITEVQPEEYEASKLEKKEEHKQVSSEPKKKKPIWSFFKYLWNGQEIDY